MDFQRSPDSLDPDCLFALSFAADPHAVINATQAPKIMAKNIFSFYSPLFLLVFTTYDLTEKQPKK